MQEIWTRDDMKHLKTFTEQAHKSILLPSQSVLPNLIQFYFYHCICMLQKLITSTLIIRHPCCRDHLWGKWKSTAGIRIWTFVTAMIMKTQSEIWTHTEKITHHYRLFFSSIFTQPNNRGSQQHRIANFCFVLSCCTVEAAAAVMHKTDQKNGGPGWCKVFSLEPDLFNLFFEVFSITLYTIVILLFTFDRKSELLPFMEAFQSCSGERATLAMDKKESKLVE